MKYEKITLLISLDIFLRYGTKLYNDGTIQPGAIYATFWAVVGGALSLGMAASQISAIMTAQTAASSIFEVIDRVSYK